MRRRKVTHFSVAEITNFAAPYLFSFLHSHISNRSKRSTFEERFRMETNVHKVKETREITSRRINQAEVLDAEKIGLENLPTELMTLVSCNMLEI